MAARTGTPGQRRTGLGVLMSREDSERAICAQTDPDLFFEPEGKGTAADKARRIRAAKRICGACDVRQACIEVATANGEQEGIWGGLTPEERGVYTKAERTRQYRERVAS